MSTRAANFVIYTDPDFINEAGYVREVEAICVMNGVLSAFTIRRRTFMFCKSWYELSVKLCSLRTGRPCGIKQFDTLDEALEYGKDFVKQIFPLVDVNDAQLNEVPAECAATHE